MKNINYSAKDKAREEKRRQEIEDLKLKLERLEKEVP